MSPDFSLLNDIYSDMAPLDSTANSFQSIHERLDKIEASIASFTTKVLAKLEAVVQRQQPRLSTGISRRPLVDVNESRPANPDVNTLIEKTLSNPRITNGAQLGIELSKIYACGTCPFALKWLPKSVILLATKLLSFLLAQIKIDS